MPALPWMKMWIEALDDSKLTRLSLAERGAWWGLLQLAHRCEAGGKVVSGGQAMTMEEITDALHIKNGEDRESLRSMIEKMQARGSLVWNGETLFVIHLDERQTIPPSAERSAVAERVRQHRARKQEHKPMDPMLAEMQTRIGIEYKERRNELGRELTTEERLGLEDQIGKKLEEKHGRKIGDAIEQNYGRDARHSWEQAQPGGAEG